MPRPFRRVALPALVALAATLVFAGTAQAAVNTYCVAAPGDTSAFLATCQAIANSHTSATFAAAMTDAVTTSTPSAQSEVHLGPGEFAVAGATTPKDATGKPVTVLGSGRASTTIRTTGSAAALELDEPTSKVSALRIEQGNGPSNALRLKNGAWADGIDVNVALATLGGDSAVQVELGGTLSHSTVSITPRPGAEEHYAIGVFVKDVNSIVHAEITDTTVRAAVGVLIENDTMTSGSSFALLQRDAIHASLNGIYQTNTGGGNVISHVSSTLVDMSAATSPSLIGIENDPDSASASSTAMDVWDSTVVGPPTTGLGVSSSLLNGASYGFTRVENTAIAGFFQSVLRGGSGTAVHDSIHVEKSALNYSTIYDGGTPAYVERPNVQNLPTIEDFGFADAANGDFRPRFDSPLVDPYVAATPDPYEDGMNESATDLAGAPRITLGPTGKPAGAAAIDTGAFEYVPAAPTVTLTTSVAHGLPGATVTFTATGADADPGEAAQLSYVWHFTDGDTLSGASVSRVLPAGTTYSGSVTVIDPTNRSGSGSASVAIDTPPPVVVVTPPPVITGQNGAGTLKDVIAPKLSFGKLVASLKALSGGKATTFTTTTSEGATLTSTLQLLVTTKVKKHGKTVKVVRTVALGTVVVTPTAAGKVSLKLVLSKSQRARLVAARKTKSATFAYVLSTVAKDAVGNSSTTKAPVRVGK